MAVTIKQLPGEGKMLAKEKIKLTLLKLLETYNADELTVKMICMEAQISKQTLYNNYYGILDAVEEVIDEFIAGMVADFHRTDDWFDGILSALEMIGKSKEVANHIYHSKYKKDVLKAISERISPIIRQGILEEAAEPGIEISAADREIMTDMYMDVFMGLITRYMDRKMTDDPHRIIGTYRAIMSGRTADAISNINATSN